MGINRTNIADHLMDYQLSMVGKTIAEAYKTDEWYHKWTMTDEQFEQFKNYSVPLLKKVFRCNKRKAEAIFGSFILEFGLRIDNENKMEDYAEEL
jgi:hypothetical protein